MIKNLVYFFLITYLTANDLDCLIQSIFKNLNIELETKLNIVKHKKISDFDSNPSHENPLHKLLELEDFKSKANLEQILINYSTLDPTIQKSILECNLPKENVLKRCNKLFTEEGCEQIDEYTVAKKCQKNYFSIGYSYCVPICPIGYDSIDNDPFFCSKTIFTQRSEVFSKSGLVKKNYRGVFEVESCPEGFREIDNDICIRICPRGWEDFGTVCKKPVLERRQNEIFFYNFDYDSATAEQK